MADLSLEEFLSKVSPEEAALLRSVRARVLQGGTLSERPEVREREGALQGGVVFLRQGVEVARLWLREAGAPRLALGAEAPIEITGLKVAALAAEKVLAAGAQAAQRAPQLDMFGGKRS